MTPELEHNFSEQINFLLKYFRRLDVFEMQYGYATVHTKNNLGISGGIKRHAFINPMVNGDVTIKSQTKLVPAELNLLFTIDKDSVTSTANVSAALNSDVLTNFTARCDQSKVAHEIASWAFHRDFEKHAADAARVIAAANHLKWEAYIPADEDARELYEILYIHFPASDTWLAFRFFMITDESYGIQILNESSGFIIEKNDVKYVSKYESFVGAEDSSNLELYDLDSCALDNDALFDFEKLHCAFDYVKEEFKANQDDPFIEPSELENDELHFLCGSQGNLESMLTLICHASIPMQHWNKLNPLEINIDSATEDGEEATIDYDSMSYGNWPHVTEILGDKLTFLEQALNAALDQNQPCGHTWEYNDGYYDRRSGYDHQACRLNFEISAPSAHEQICAKLEMKKLTKVMGKAVIKELLG